MTTIENGARVKFTVIGEWRNGIVYPDGGQVFDYIEAELVDLGTVEVLPDPIKPGDYFVNKNARRSDVWLAVGGGYIRLTNGRGPVQSYDLNDLNANYEAISFEEANAIITGKTR